MEYIPRIDSLLSSGKEEKVPLFDIQFPLDSVFMQVNPIQPNSTEFNQIHIQQN